MKKTKGMKKLLRRLAEMDARLSEIERRLTELEAPRVNITSTWGSSTGDAARWPAPGVVQFTPTVRLTLPCPPGECDFPMVWHGIVPPNCSKCGRPAQMLMPTFTVTQGALSIMPEWFFTDTKVVG